LFNGAPIALVPLASALGVSSNHSIRLPDKAPVVVVGTEGNVAALLVDELVDEQDILVRNIGAAFVGLYMSRDRPSSRMEMLRWCFIRPRFFVQHFKWQRILQSLMRCLSNSVGHPVVDDTVTTRMLEKLSRNCRLRGHRHGRRVRGLDLLQKGGVNLVLSDVEMPRKDGFELTRSIRASAQCATCRGVAYRRQSEKDKQLGAEAGADAYLVKGVFDQATLLSVIKQLI